MTGGPKNGPKTGILKSIVFHKIPTVEFHFAAISLTACNGREGWKFLPLYTSTLLLVHVSQKPELPICYDLE
jgi:hypothetical protein